MQKESILKKIFTDFEKELSTLKLPEGIKYTKFGYNRTYAGFFMGLNLAITIKCNTACIPEGRYECSLSTSNFIINDTILDFLRALNNIVLEYNEKTFKNGGKV